MVRETKGDRAVEHTREPTRDLSRFDYGDPAELFLSRAKRAKGRPRYRRFDTAAEAVRFIIEELPAAVLAGAYLLVEEKRFGVEEIRSLYEGDGYPLPRALEKV